MFYVFVKILCYGCSCFVNAVQCSQQRCLIVEWFTWVWDENCRNAQGVVVDKGWRWNIPCRITTSLECVANATIWETWGVRLLLNEQLAAKFFNHSWLAVVLNEWIVFFGCAVGEWVKPVCVVRTPFFHCPFLKTGGHTVGYSDVERHLVVDGVGESIERFLW